MPRQNKATRSPEISRQQVQKPRASRNAAKTEQGNSVTRDLPPTGSETPSES